MHGRNVVDSEHLRSGQICDHVRGNRRGHAVACVATREPAEKRLARGADHHRATERHDLVEPPEELEVVREGLPEADPRVEQDPLLRDAVCDRKLHPLLEEGCDLADDVLVTRILLHRPRLSEHVHEAAVRAAAGDQLGHLRIAAERCHVVDQRRARLERRPRDGRL